jgi:hypothetical protein
MASGIFVSYRGFLEPPYGGVQICTREYVDVIKAAGIDLEFCAFSGDQRLSTRILRRLNSSSYFRSAETAVADAIFRIAAKNQPDFIFLNQVSLAPLAQKIRRAIPTGCKIVMLSHGLESTDLLHVIRTRGRLPLTARVRPTPAFALGDALIAETTFRPDIDVVCALSPFDVALEHWVGATHVGWLPRVVIARPLDWYPSGKRLGFIGTLDHAPNLEGLVLVLEQLMRLDTGSLRVRVVGAPAKTGRWLAQNYSIVDYLGPLSDSALVEEASSWNAVVHPIFCYSRGCSTKLAMAVGWHLPVITTTMGHRGYEWREGGLVIANEPVRFANECLRLLDFETATAARCRVMEMAHSSPTVEENASRLLALLDH